MDMFKRAKAPLSSAERQQLKTDAANIRATATRKGHTLDAWAESAERNAAADHFELGCWLFYYNRRVGRDTVESRIDCARRIFVAGITNPGYDFFTVFDFGERQFDTIFEMGDANEVIDGLRKFLFTDTSGNLRKAFNYMGWPMTAPDLLSI
jgi:hypothetical protein